IRNLRFLEHLPQPALTSLVMLSRRSDRNAHDGRGLLDAQVVVEDELERLALAAREPRERAVEGAARLGAADGIFGMLDAVGRGCLREPEREKAPERVAAPAVGGGPANDGKEPGLKRRLCAKTRLALEDLQVDDLEHLLGLVRVAAAAGKRPTVARRVPRLQMISDLCLVHSFSSVGVL